MCQLTRGSVTDAKAQFSALIILNDCLSHENNVIRDLALEKNFFAEQTKYVGGGIRS